MSKPAGPTVRNDLMRAAQDYVAGAAKSAAATLHAGERTLDLYGWA